MGDQSFEPRLESLRGLAALNVAAHHGLVTFAVQPDDRTLLFTIVHTWLLERLSNPNMSVMFFFVLSGYVLGRSLERDPNYFRFITKRALRILPAFVVSVFVAYFCLTAIRLESLPAGLSTYFPNWFYPAPVFSDLINNLIFRSTRVNGPTWSIHWEVIGSIFLPLLVYLHLKAPRPLQLLLFFAASIFMLFAHTRAGLLPIVEYFYAGFFLPPLIARLIPGGWIVRTIFFTFGYWLILSAGTKNSIELTAIITSSVGAVLMISAILSSTDFMLWLEHPSLRLLGRISYSFYLFHFPIFYVTAVAAIWLGLPHAEIGNWLIAVASILIAMPVSAISYHFIEVRSMRIGRRLRDPAYRKLPAA